jgi:hypothetical protein
LGRLLAELGTLVQERPFQHISIVLATPKESAPQYLARAERVPGATLIVGRRRFRARISEAVARALGAKPRRHLRRSERVGVVFCSAGRVQERAMLMNISESGALVATRRTLAADERVVVGFTLGNTPFAVGARVVRCRRTGEGYEAGLDFEALAPAEVEAIAQFVLEDTLKATVPKRVEQRRLPRRAPSVEGVRLKVRLRPVGQVGTAYLRMVDLSEAGFLRSQHWE